MLIGGTKINVNYDEIKMISNNLGYYLVKSNSKYGVINSKEELVIYIEYDKIGIDLAKFKSAKVKSQYILCNKLIPVYLDEKWGMFDISGKKFLEIEYDDIGCIAGNSFVQRAVDDVLIVGDTDVVVISQDDKYGGISTRGDLLLPIAFQCVYSVTSDGKTNYFIRYNDIDYSATEYIERMKEILGYEETETPEEPEDDNNEENNSQEQNENQNEGNNTENNVENNTENNTEGNAENNAEENTENNNAENNVEGNTEEQDQTINDAQIFNSKFEAYVGAHSKNTINTLVEAVIDSNSTHDNKVQVEFNGKIYKDNVSEILNKINNNAYNVIIEHNQETGYVEKIIIN